MVPAAQAALRAAGAALAAVDRRRVRAIGVSGQQHGLVVLDGAGQVTRWRLSPPTNTLK